MNPDVNWLDGVQGGVLLDKEHDIHWLNYQKQMYLGN